MSNSQNCTDQACSALPIVRATLLLLALICLSNNIGLVQANQLKTRSRNQLNLEAFERAEGIYDRVVQKLEQKEEAKEKMVQEQVNEQLMMQQQAQIDSNREEGINTPYPSTLEGDVQDVQQALKEINTNGKTKLSKKLTYEEQIAQIAKQQDQENDKYKDDFEGFGSLTEMVKNKDKIAEEKAKSLEVIEEEKQKEEEKKRLLEKAKAKMTAALEKDTKDRKVKELKAKALQKIPSKPPVSHLLSLSAKKGQKKLITAKKPALVKKAPIKKVVKPVIKKQAVVSKSALAKKLAAKLAQKSKASNKNLAPIVSQSEAFPPFASYVQANETSEQEMIQEEAINANTTMNKTKLFDGSVDQVIDQVYNEHESKIEEQHYKESLPKPQKKEEEETHEEGYLSKFRKKFSNLNENENSDNQQVQVASQVEATAAEQTESKHKGIMERFNDKITEEVSDQEKTQEIISTVQRSMNKSKKQNFIDRESEKLIREQDEDLANDDELAQASSQ